MLRLTETHIYAFLFIMNTRLTIDLKKPELFTLLKMESLRLHQSVRSIVVTALESYFLHRKENQALTKMANRIFEEWDNSKDSKYDKL
jgi:hypothetical protein